MASSSRLVISALFMIALGFVGVRAVDIEVGGGTDGGEPAIQISGSDGVDYSSLKIELGQLKSKILALESGIMEKTQELERKDKEIAQKEKIIQDKSDSIGLLESEISSLQKKVKLDAAEQLGKAHARAGELEKQIDNLKKELDFQKGKKEALEARASEAEKKLGELNSKLHDLQKINEEQKSKTHKTERALKVAEEEMMKAKFEATSKTKELIEVHGAWLPPWLAIQLTRLQAHWNVHGKPAMDLAVQKALEKKVQAEKWAEPHVETIRTIWIPAIKEQWRVIVTNVEPHVHTLTSKTVEAYEASKTAVTPHVIKAQEFVDPYFQVCIPL
uniref:Uncharacterized protein n=1 Tax=Rhizophora mucronata TaxID=61149 RepID=A0A2P2L2T0_RHIMU